MHSRIAVSAFLVLATAFCDDSDGPRSRGERVAPVEVSAVRSGPISLRRTFSGSLEARAAISIAPKLTGRVVDLPVDIGDEVKRGQLVAQLETGDLRQNVSTAEAELQLQQASHQAVQAEAQQAQRNLERITELHKKNITAESQLDEAIANAAAAQARVQEAAARVARARSELKGANIRLGYTRVVASWPDGDDVRVVAERFVDAGDLLAANSPILRVVEVDPLTAIFFVTEVDYPKLKLGQSVGLSTDAYPGVTF
ncbi:MAG: efflux RND transporter periplasmic adaptor subunit, partial [Myxococcota bacterium]